MDDASKGGAKRKKYYNPAPQKRRKFILEPGLKGFLCSCNFREKECISESYNLLNKYADELYGSDKAECSGADQDLAKEIESLKENTARRFQVVESGAKNFLFIRTTVEDPVKLAESIVKDMHEKKQKQTRFLLRLVPVEATCKAYMEDIKKECKTLLEKYFKGAPRSYSIIYNHRNNDSLSKDDVIKMIADEVAEMRPDHKVNLKGAEVSIIVEIIRGMALLGVVPHYIKYKKYNLHGIAEGAKHNEEGGGTTKDEAKFEKDKEAAQDDDVKDESESSNKVPSTL